MLRRAKQTKRQIIEQLNRRVLGEQNSAASVGGTGKVTSLTDIEAVGWAKKLHSTMKGINTSSDEDTFWALTNKFKECKSCIEKIKTAFNKTFSSAGAGDLKSWIVGDFNQDQREFVGGDERTPALEAWGYEGLESGDYIW